MIEITEHISLHESEIHEEFIRASGPGGQNVNKVATAVQLRFNVKHSPSLPDEVRERLIESAGKRINESGELVIEAKRYRSQERNRQDAIERLAELIRKAMEKPKPRRKPKRTPASQEQRLHEKRRRSETKRRRAYKPNWDD